MRERVELGPLQAVDPAAAPWRVELLAPSLDHRLQWMALGLGCALLVWGIAVATGWVRATGWAIVTRRLPRGPEHLLWALPAIFAAACVLMALRGARVAIDERRLGIFGLWPLPVRREFDLARLQTATFHVGVADGEAVFLVDLLFPDAVVVLHLRERWVWQALKMRFRGRNGA